MTIFHLEVEKKKTFQLHFQQKLINVSQRKNPSRLDRKKIIQTPLDIISLHLLKSKSKTELQEQSKESKKRAEVPTEAQKQLDSPTDNPLQASAQRLSSTFRQRLSSINTGINKEES